MMNARDLFPRAKSKRRSPEPVQLDLPWPDAQPLTLGSVDAFEVESPLHTLARAEEFERIRASEVRGGSGSPVATDEVLEIWRRRASACRNESKPKNRNHGGRRAGAGRKRNPKRTPHLARTMHEAEYPVHVIVRVRPEVIQTLRVPSIGKLVKNIVWDQLHPSRIYSQVFRIVQYSIQRHEIHLIAEAKELEGATTKAGKPYTATQALRGGISGFVIAFAHRLNKLCGRGQTGKVWATRYERRDLRTPDAMRTALRTLFRMAEDRGEVVDETGIDPYSSAVAFSYFENAPWGPDYDEEEEGWPPAASETALARGGWRLAGPLYSSIETEVFDLAAPCAKTRMEMLLAATHADVPEDFHRRHVFCMGRPKSQLRGAYAPYVIDM